MAGPSNARNGLTRRRLLWVMGFVVAALAGAVAWLRRPRRASDAITRAEPWAAGPPKSPPEPTASQARLIGQLREHFDYLDIDDETLRRFANDFELQREPLAPGTELSGSDHTRFLMSTDFFQNGADESRPLRYVAYYDPYVSPCYNPLVGTA